MDLRTRRNDGGGAAALAVLVAAAALAGCETEAPLPEDPLARRAAPWIEQLKKGDPVQRDQAIAELGKIDHPCVLDPLLETAYYDIQMLLRVRALRTLGGLTVVRDSKPIVSLLSSPDDEVRLAACEVLGRLKAADAMEPLAGCINDRVSFVRLAALQALSQMGPSGLERLDKMFREGSVEERVAIAEVFGRTGDRRHVEVLVAALRADEDAIRRAAAEALGRLGDDRAIEPLKGLVLRPLSDARLAEFQKRLDSKPTKADYDAIIAILDMELVKQGRRPGGGEHQWLYRTPDAHKPVLKRILDQRRRAAAQLVRASAVAALLQTSQPAARNALIALLAHEDPDVGESVWKVFAQREDSGEILYEIAQDPKQPSLARVRAVQVLTGEAEAAAESSVASLLLEMLKSEEDFAGENRPLLKAPPAPPAPLDDRLQAALIAGLSDPDPAFRGQCAKILAVRQTPKALDPLITLLDHPDLDVKALAVEGLANYKDPRPVPQLAALLRNKSAEPLHKRTIETLAAIGDKGVVPALLQVATATRHPLQIEALQAVAKVGDPSAGPPLLEYYRAMAEGHEKITRDEERHYSWIVHHTIIALGKCRAADAVPDLIKIVQGEGYGNDTEAMTALGLIGDLAAVEPIIARMRAGKHRVKGERFVNYTTQAGLAALGRLGDPRAVPLLVEFTRSPPDKFTIDYTFTALGQLKCPEAADALVRLLTDPKVDMSAKETNVGPALAQVGTVAKEPLLRVLADTPRKADDAAYDPGIYAAQLLALMGKEVLPPLAEIARTSAGKPYVLGRVIEALQRIGDDEAVTALGGLLRHQDATVRQWAVVALGKSGRPAAAPLIEEAKNDKNPEVRTWADWALQQPGIKG
jgi:HEAT repeat protein